MPHSLPTRRESCNAHVECTDREICIGDHVVIKGKGKHRLKLGLVIMFGTRKDEVVVLLKGPTDLGLAVVVVKRKSVVHRDPEEDTVPLDLGCLTTESCKCFHEESEVSHEMVTVTSGNYKSYYGYPVKSYNSGMVYLALYGLSDIKIFREESFDTCADRPSIRGSLSPVHEAAVSLARKAALSHQEDDGNSDELSTRDATALKSAFGTAAGSGEGEHAPEAAWEEDTPTISKYFTLSIIVKMAKGLIGIETVDVSEVTNVQGCDDSQSR